MELTEAIATRRSIRKFAERPVPRELLTELIEAAALAPTASNLQAWRYIVVDDPALVREVDAFSPGLSGRPPVIIAIASDLIEVERRGSKNSLVYGCMMDAAMAAENLMLKAVDLGLGTCAIKSYNDAAVRRLLRLPDTMRLEILIAVGWPDQAPRTPARKPMETVLRWNQWDAEETVPVASPETRISQNTTAAPRDGDAVPAATGLEGSLTAILIYLITSAAGLQGEPVIYGPLRLIESARRLALYMNDQEPNAALEQLVRLIWDNKSKNMTDPEGFYEMLREASRQAVDLV